MATDPFDFGPLTTPASSPFVPSNDEHFVVRPVLESAEADARVKDIIFNALLRPADIGTSAVEAPTLLYAPFWRVEAFGAGVHFGIGMGKGSWRPEGGVDAKADTFCIPARRLLKWTEGAAPKIHSQDMAPATGLVLDDGIVVEADLTRDAAVDEAKRRLKKKDESVSTIVSAFEVHVRSLAFVHYPMWVARYRYVGEAAGAVPPTWFVALSARSGKVVSESHPSRIRSVASKLRRLFD